MKVKPQYKQTEVGVIPEDWSVMQFAQAVGSYIDYRGRTPRKLGLAWGGGDILALSANNVQMGRIDPDKEAYFGSEELYRKWMVKGECELGDVLLTMEAPLGSIAQIPDSKKYILSQRVILIKPKGLLLRDYLAHYMKGAFFQAQLTLNATGSTAKGIQRRKLDQLTVYFPPNKVEQESIAEALSDADTLIRSLEQILAKKRQIKQGAMQELLTGKKRLPGFVVMPGYKQTEMGTIPRDWGIIRTADVCTKVQDGTHFSPRVGGNDYLYLTSKNIRFGYLDISTATRIDAAQHHAIYRRCDVKRGDLLLTKDGANTGNAALNTLDEEFSLLSSVAFLRFPEAQHCASYFLQQILSSQGQHQIQDAMAGNAITRLTLEKIKKLLFPVPPTRGEQEAIAAILNDMDTEILALEAKLTKARQIKQGMMQELLTGRIRLV